MYRGEGLNLYAYCANNPVVYYDPSGYDDKVCKETDDVNGINNNILGIPVNEWSDEDVQRAVDSVHEAQYNGDRYGQQNPYTISVTENGEVIISGASKHPGPQAQRKGYEIFGKDNVAFVSSGKTTLYDGISDNDLTNPHHSEARGIQYMKDNGMKTEGSRQATTSYSCDSCVDKQNVNGVRNITGAAADHNNTFKRDKMENLW